MILVYSRRDFLTQSFQTLRRLPSFVSKPWQADREQSESKAKSSYRYLRPTDAVLLSRLLPVVLGVHIDPSEPEDQQLLVQCLQVFDYGLGQVSELSRSRIQQLLSYLNQLPSKIWYGLWRRFGLGESQELQYLLLRFEQQCFAGPAEASPSLLRILQTLAQDISSIRSIERLARKRKFSSN